MTAQVDLEALVAKGKSPFRRPIVEEPWWVMREQKA
jgi:hypothetical protein